MIRNSCEIKIRYALLLCSMCMVKRFIFVRNKKRFIWWKLLHFVSIRNYTFGRFDFTTFNLKTNGSTVQKLTKWLKVVEYKLRAHQSSIQETLNRSPKQVSYSLELLPWSPGQYIAQPSSLGFVDVVAYMLMLFGRMPSNILPDSHASK